MPHFWLPHAPCRINWEKKPVRPSRATCHVRDDHLFQVVMWESKKHGEPNGLTS